MLRELPKVWEYPHLTTNGTNLNERPKMIGFVHVETKNGRWRFIATCETVIFDGD